MRITNNMITYNFLTSLNKSLQRQNEIQEQLSDGKAIHRPSDNPIKTIRSLRFDTNLALNEQYTQNVKDAISWMESSDSALSDMSSIVIRAKELVIQAIAPNPAESFQAIGEEIDGLINQLVAIGNTKIGDRYIFAGQNDHVEPFSRAATGTPPVDSVTYAGDDVPISMRIQAGTINAEQDSVSVTGKEIFGANLELFNHLIEIKDQLKSGNPDLTLLSNMIGDIDSDHAQLLRAQTKVGTRMSMYEMAQNMLEDNSTTITNDLSANEDIDIARAIIDFKTSENVYKTALSVGARIMPPSLVDFLR